MEVRGDCVCFFEATVKWTAKDGLPDNEGRGHVMGGGICSNLAEIKLKCEKQHDCIGWRVPLLQSSVSLRQFFALHMQTELVVETHKSWSLVFGSLHLCAVK